MSDVEHFLLFIKVYFMLSDLEYFLLSGMVYFLLFVTVYFLLSDLEYFLLSCMEYFCCLLRCIFRWQIWSIADPRGTGALDKAGLFVALKMIALAQNNKPVDVCNARLNVQPPNMVVDPVLPLFHNSIT